MIVDYLDKFFHTNIIILESGLQARIDTSLLPKCCNYNFVFDDNFFLHRTRCLNWLMDRCETDIVSIYDCDVVLAIDQIMGSVARLRERLAECVYPYDGTFVNVDAVFKAMFSKILDPELLSVNSSKFLTVTKRSFGGAMFLAREAFYACGGENEYFQSWGPEDLERVKRFTTLGLKVERYEGPIFHLPHERNENSGYPDLNTKETYMNEYFKICNMYADELRVYVSMWPWVNKSVRLMDQ